MNLWIIISIATFIVALVICYPLLPFLKNSQLITTHKTSSFKAQKHFMIMTLIIITLVPVLSLCWYHHFGASQQLEHQIRPHDANEWYILGQIYFENGAYKKSITSLKKAHQLKPDNTTYSIALAQSLFFKDNKKLSTEAKNLLTDILSQQPDSPDAINLLAVNDYLAGHYHQAIKRWKLLLPYYSADSPDGKALRMMIAKAESDGVKS